MVSLLVIGSVIANYWLLGQDAFIRETILMAICSLLQNREFIALWNRRLCLIFEISGFVSFKIGCFVLPPPRSLDRTVPFCNYCTEYNYVNSLAKINGFEAQNLKILNLFKKVVGTKIS